MDAPTYRDLGRHAEAIEIDYDPALISYDTLLDVFWSGHSPTAGAWSTQYMAVLWVHDDEQRKAAEASRDRLAARLGGKIQTEIRDAQRFWRAEDYHQKYSLRSRRDVAHRVRGLYSGEQEFVDSTLAARLNAVLGGNRPADPQAWLDDGRLEDDEREVLAELLGLGGGAAARTRPTTR